MINWKVRIKNKTFWLAIIPALFLLVQQILGMAGVSVDFTATVEALMDIVNTVFVILAILGIVVDPTTAGINDSTRAMLYEEPKEN